MQAAQYIEYDSSFGEEEEQAKVLEVSCSLNNVVCKLKLKNYKQAENIIRTLYGSIVMIRGFLKNTNTHFKIHCGFLGW